VISGILFGQIGYCMMHDASHYAVYPNYKEETNLNEMASLIVNNFMMWGDISWLRHHVHRHHGFTGDCNFDPDQMFMNPWIKKSHFPDNIKYIVNKFNDKYFYIFSFMFIFIFPTLYLGQAISYFSFYLRRRAMWNMKYPNISRKKYEYILITIIWIFNIGCHYYGSSILVSYLFFFGLNFAYAINILPDHDTESTFKNINKIRSNDWLEIQVRGSANFCTNKYFDIWSLMFGGINYQIVHHLYPSISHIHYPGINKIIKEFCKENDIEYVEYDSVFNSVLSVFRELKDLNKN
jgi:linoleoyl-CoA desaturase